MITDEIRNVFKQHDMTLHDRDEQDGEFYRELEFYSPEGEDVVETIWYDGTAEGFVSALVKHAEGFDPEEHAEPWIGHRGKDGVPKSIIALINDAIWIKNELLSVADELGVAVHTRYGEESQINRLSIELSDGTYLVAELCEYGGECDPEIVLCIQDKEGIAIQDIVLARKARTKEPGVTVLVWSDKNDEDYTHSFWIPEYDGEED